MIRLARSALVVATVTLAATLAPSSTAAPPAKPFTATIDLPNGFQPEGIAIGRGPNAWLGSLADGDIYRANLRSGRGEVISEGPGTPSVGLKVDRRGRLGKSEGGVVGALRLRVGQADERLRQPVHGVGDGVGWASW